MEPVVVEVICGGCGGCSGTIHDFRVSERAKCACVETAADGMERRKCGCATASCGVGRGGNGTSFVAGPSLR